MLAHAALAATAFTAGHSVQERPIRVAGPDSARVLVVGSVHGNETAGHAIVKELRRTRARVWTVLSVNPDGVRLSTRHNARDVDLNRNFSRRWRPGSKGDVFYPGPKAASEPETRTVMRLVRRLEPAVTIWFHQHLRLVNLSPGADPRIVRDYARRVGLPARKLPRYRGTATSWQNHSFRKGSAFVVELPAGELAREDVKRHVAAVEAAAARAHTAAAAKRPRIRWHPIPFGSERKDQMRAYSRRHYGIRSVALEEPRTIVEHVTASPSFESAFNTFASNARDPELRERPGVCAHFLIDTDGAIHQLVSLKYMCRHTIGLNHRSIGIEHVARTDGELMGRSRQLAASLRLTRWLMARDDIPAEHVIGHAESLDSPFYEERVKRLRSRTHGDMAPATMRRYRDRL